MTVRTIGIEIKDKTFVALEKLAADEDMTVGELGQRVITRYVRRMLQKADGTYRPANTFELRGLIELILKQDAASRTPGKPEGAAFAEWDEDRRGEQQRAAAT